MRTPLHDHDLFQSVGEEANPIVVVPADTTPDLTPDEDDSMFWDSASSHHTLSTIQSREVADYFRSIFGYTFCADESVPLVWPADSTAERLDVVQHVIMHLCMGGQNVPPAVDEMLRTGGVGENKAGARVLDMVTNSGTWVNEMASVYSTASFISLDSKPLIPHRPHSRIQFEVYDFYAGIVESDNSFDLVHLRQGVLATKNFNFLLQELHRVLKPSGYIMISEIPMEGFEDAELQVPIHSAVHIAEAIKLVYDTCKAEGADVTVWHDISARLSPDHVLWGNHQTELTESSLDPNERQEDTWPARGFRDINLRSIPLPIGAWPADENQKILGSLTRLWGYHHAESLLPMVMLKGEMEEEQAREFIQKLHQEVMEVDRYRVYLAYHICLARKI